MELEEPIVTDKRSFNFFTSIWIIPIIALIIAVWLSYEHYLKQGPEIKIYFKNSGGLNAGHSIIKFRDVPIGKIDRIEINNEKNGVIIHAKMNKDAEVFLNNTTKFWIIKPEVDYSGVKGLDTLLSGSYIKMYAKKDSKLKKEFNGLKSAYININNGHYYAIESTFPIKIKKHAPIYYKGIKVGEVDKISLNIDSKNIIIIARIYKDYSKLINITTKFWIQDLLDLQLNNNRLKANMAPLPTMLFGGLSLDSKFDKEYSRGYSKVFKLYKSETEAKQKKIGVTSPIPTKFLFKFKGDISSLVEGAEIKYKGFKVGKIKKLKIEYNKEYKGFKAEGLGVIDISNFSTNKNDAFKNFKTLLKDGLVARLEKPNPLFNKSNIILEEDNSSKIELKKDNLYSAYIIPTKEYRDNSIFNKLTKITDKINTILDSSKKPIKNLNKVLIVSQELIQNVNKIVNNKEFRDLGKSITKILNTLKTTLETTTKIIQGYSSNSLFGDKVEATLNNLHNMTEKTNYLLKKLIKKPNSLIFGD